MGNGRGGHCKCEFRGMRYDVCMSGVSIYGDKKNALAIFHGRNKELTIGEWLFLGEGTMSDVTCNGVRQGTINKEPHWFFARAEENLLVEPAVQSIAVRQQAAAWREVYNLCSKLGMTEGGIDKVQDFIVSLDAARKAHEQCEGQARAWEAVYSLCLKLGMPSGMIEGVCGRDKVLEFIRNAMAKNLTGEEADQARAWRSVWDTCVILGMDNRGMSGTEAVVKFIRTLGARVYDLETITAGIRDTIGSVVGGFTENLKHYYERYPRYRKEG